MILPQHLARQLAEARKSAQAGDLQQAARLYNGLVSEEPNLAEAWLELLRLLIQANQTAIASECCRVWRLKAPASGPSLAIAHHDLGIHLFALGQTAAAATAFQAATEIDPSLVLAWRNLASALLAEERAAEALEPARRALALSPADPESRFLLAFALADTGDLATARILAETLADAAPDNARYHYFLEDLLLRADQGAEVLHRNAAFHARVLATLEQAAASGTLAALQALERHLIGQGDAAAAWDAYERVAAHADFSASQRSTAFIAGRHLAAGSLLAPPDGNALTSLRATLAAPAIAGGAKRLVMLLLVRDEADLIRDTIAFHLDQGVDFVIVTDNGSIDGTRDLLADMERDLPLLVLDEPSHSYQQDLWTTRMGYLAADFHRAEWIFSADADEFWCPEEGDLPSAIARDAAHYGRDTNLLIVPPVMMVPDRTAAAQPGFRPISTRRVFRQPLGNAESVSRWPTSWPLHRQMAKMMFRGEGFVALWPGNHYAVMERAHYGCARHLLIHHFHLRSFAHLRRKIAMTHQAMKDNSQWDDVVGDFARKLALDEAGKLAAEYERATWPTDLYRAAESSGRLIETDRILAAADRAPIRRGAEDGDAAGLSAAGRRYIDAITPLVPRFKTVAVGTSPGR